MPRWWLRARVSLRAASRGNRRQCRRVTSPGWERSAGRSRGCTCARADAERLGRRARKEEERVDDVARRIKAELEEERASLEARLQRLRGGTEHPFVDRGKGHIDTTADEIRDVEGCLARIEEELSGFAGDT